MLKKHASCEEGRQWKTNLIENIKKRKKKKSPDTIMTSQPFIMSY